MTLKYESRQIDIYENKPSIPYISVNPFFKWKTRDLKSGFQTKRE